MKEELVLTLIGPDGHRHEPPRPVVAEVDEPHTLLPTITEMVRAVRIPEHGNGAVSVSDYETEVALSDGRVRYLLLVGR